MSRARWAPLTGRTYSIQARAETTRIMSIGLFVGGRVPACCTSMGRVLLAHLPDDKIAGYLAETPLHPRTPRTVISKSMLLAIFEDIRRQAYAVVDQELEMGRRSIAIPVHDRNGTVVAAINVGTQSARISIKDLVQRVLPELKSTTAELTSIL
jgi:IclR family pca regulon transcriptional regulator